MYQSYFILFRLQSCMRICRPKTCTDMHAVEIENKYTPVLLKIMYPPLYLGFKKRVIFRAKLMWKYYWWCRKMANILFQGFLLGENVMTTKALPIRWVRLTRGLRNGSFSEQNWCRNINDDVERRPTFCFKDFYWEKMSWHQILTHQKKVHYIEIFVPK